MRTLDRVWLFDAIERSLSTYIQSFIGFLIVSGVTDLSAVKTAAIAAIPAGLSLLKSLIAQRYAPGTVSPASFVPARSRRRLDLTRG